jgi:malonate-semialdehyde dehydrogenase (acetylating)/methylmalonate-semialdehyde dehydrogenase
MRRLIRSGFAASGRAGTLPARSSALASRAAFTNTSRQHRCLHATSGLCRSILSLNTTSTSFPTTHDALKPVDTPYFIDNQFINSTATKFIDVHDPATNNVITRVPEMTDGEMEAAVASAEKAFDSWSQTTVLTRQQIMFRFVQLIRENFERLAASCTLEQGKTLADGRGDVLRGIQVAEAAIAAPEFLKGELLEVSKDMETRSYREPLGVVAAICPFSE